MVAAQVITEMVVRGSQRVEQSMRRQQRALDTGSSRMNKSLLAMGASVAAVGMAAFQAFGAMNRLMAQASVEAEKLQRQVALLNKTFKTFEKLEGPNALDLKSVNKQMEDLFETTTATRSQIVRIQAAIARTSRNPDIFRRATQATLDVMAARPEWSAEAASQWVTTLLGDPGRTVDKFRRAEIQVTKEFQKQLEILVEQGQIREAQSLVLSQLESRFSGAASTAAATVTGQWEVQSKRVLDSFAEASLMMKEEMLPTFREMADIVSENKETISASMRDLAKFSAASAEAFAEIGRILKETLGPAYEAYAGLYGVERVDTSSAGVLIGGPIKMLAEIFRQSNFGEGTGADLERVWNALLEVDQRASESAPAERIQDLLDDVKNYRPPGAEDDERDAALDAYHIVNGVQSYMEKMLEVQRRQKAEEERRKKAYENFMRLGKRFQVLVQDTETPMERLQRQAQLINQWLAAGAGYAGHEQRVRMAAEVYRRLELEAMEQSNSALKKAAEAREKEYNAIQKLVDSYRRSNPFAKLLEDFERIREGSRKGMRLTGLSEAYAEMLKKALGLLDSDSGRDQGFSSISTSIENLYSTIRQGVLTRNPAVVATEKQTAEQRKMIHNLAAAITAELKAIKPGMGP